MPITNRNNGLFAPYNVDGAIGGLHGGYNWQYSQWVFGIEGDFNWIDASGDDGGAGGLIDGTKAKTESSVRGRLGYAWNNHLLYVTGGWARMDARNFRIGVASTSDDYNGWTVGGGYSVGLTPNWIASIEYRYSDYGDKNYTAGDLMHVELTGHQVTGRLTYKFGGPLGGGATNPNY